MTNYDKVKVIVVGDSGVGKTSAVHLICHNQILTSPSWTVGGSLEVKLHEYKAGTPHQKTYFIDLWDIGGSASHRNSRSVFYNGVNGIVLVHDMLNKKSETNLHKWIVEILNRDSNSGSRSNLSSNSEEDFDPELFVGSNQIPIFVIGTKVDAVSEGKGYRPATARSSSIAEECGAEEIFLNCMDLKSLAPGSTSAVKLSRFFDKVIEKRFHRESSNLFYDRKKIFPQQNFQQRGFNEDYTY